MQTLYVTYFKYENIMGKRTYYKAYLYAMVLTIEELRKLFKDCQEQSNGDASGVVYTHSVPSSSRCWHAVDVHTYTWGFLRCSFRQSGQCEGLSIVKRVTAGLHAFLYIL